MAQYIPKDALVAEIKKLIDEIYAGRPFDALSSGQQTALWYIKSIMSSIDTLEVKEVDFEKKKIEWIEQLCKYFKANYLYVSGHESFISDFRRYAKNLK